MVFFFLAWLFFLIRLILLTVCARTLHSGAVCSVMILCIYAFLVCVVNDDNVHITQLYNVMSVQYYTKMYNENGNGMTIM